MTPPATGPAELAGPVRVQVVRVVWTEASRRGEGARLRAACLVGFAWPDPDARWHRVTMREQVGFTPETLTWAALDEVPPDDVGQSGVEVSGDTVTMLPTVSPWWQPRRRRRPPRLVVRPGDRVRWLLNHRVTLEDRWRYGLTVVNVAHGSRVPPDVFLRQPTRTVDERARLW